MKFKHIAMLFATLFLPACSNNTTNNENVKRLETQSINEIPSLVENENLSEPIKNEPVHYGVDILDNRDEIEEENKSTEDYSVPQDSPSPISSYSTKVYTKTDDRMKNLNIVCEKISGVIIQPGEEFSYNNIAGPYDKAHGFGKATVLLGNGEEIQDYGGGVCQVSSTLYNAVKNCNVEILERHNHSKDIYYVPRNQDATVSYGNLDFRFKNKSDYPIKIEASANKQKVTVEIYKV